MNCINKIAMKALMFTVALAVLPGCGAAFNPNNVSQSELVTINHRVTWPYKFRTVSVDSVDAPGLSNPSKSYKYTKVAPGEHVVRWNKLWFESFSDSGLLRVTFEPGESYSLGIKEGETAVSMWNDRTGQVVSTVVPKP